MRDAKECKQPRHSMPMRLLCCAFLLFLFPVYSSTVTTFVSPDSSFAVLKDFLSNAENPKIATYTFTSAEIADMLPRGTVILVDASPAGGFPQESKAIFCAITKRGVFVYLYSGPLRYMHAKYIVNANSTLITSENFGDDGFPASPTHGNRGWGVIVENEGISRELSGIFDTDVKSSAKFACDGNYASKSINEGGSYAPVFTPKRFENQNVSLIIAPNALPQLLDMLDGAKYRLLVEQMYIYRYFDKGKPSKLLDSLMSAAGRGVNVSVILDSSYYNVDKGDRNSNYYTNLHLKNISGIESTLFDKAVGLALHNKGVVADDAVLISSINWNENSPTRNREAGVIINGEASDYFVGVFDYDFHAENRITGFATAKNIAGLGLVVLIAFVLAWLRKRKMQA